MINAFITTTAHPDVGVKMYGLLWCYFFILILVIFLLLYDDFLVPH